MYAHPQEHMHENLHVQTKLACAKNVCLILQSQLQPHLGALSGGSEITNTLLGNKRARYRKKFELGGEPGKLIIDRGDRL